MKPIIDFLIAHKGVATMAGMWVMREIPVVWPKLVSIYPYLRDNGGAVGVIKNFFVGKPKLTDTNSTN